MLSVAAERIFQFFYESGVAIVMLVVGENDYDLVFVSIFVYYGSDGCEYGSKYGCKRDDECFSVPLLLSPVSFLP